MNAKIIVIALCAAQFATAADNPFSSYFQVPISIVQSAVASFQQQITSAISQALNAAQSAIKSEEQEFTNQQANITSTLSNSSDAAPKVRACSQDGQQKATAVANSTLSQIENVAANQSAVAQVYVDQARNLVKQVLDSAAQIYTDYTTCVSKSIMPFLGDFTCLPSATAKAASVAGNLGTQIPKTIQSLQSSVTEALSNLPSLFQQNIQTAAEQLQEVVQDFEKCIEDAVADTTQS